MTDSPLRSGTSKENTMGTKSMAKSKSTFPHRRRVVSIVAGVRTVST